MGEVAKYRELNRMFADKLNVRGLYDCYASMTVKYGYAIPYRKQHFVKRFWED